MSYVAVKGGADAIRASRSLYKEMINGNFISRDTEHGNHLFALDRIMGEGALYSEKLAMEALRKTGCDLLEAAFYLRAHRSTCQRIGNCGILRLEDIRVLRRISSAFKDIPGGQLLGPSSDYLVKLFAEQKEMPVAAQSADRIPERMDSGLTPLRQTGKILQLDNEETTPFDVTRATPMPPYPRSAIMQVMARGETGAMLAFAYTSMRGYGDVHPTIGDLRIGMIDVTYPHPFTGKPVRVGAIRVTAVESVGSFKKDPVDGKLRLATGFGFCFGFNETKAIAMSILDLALTWPHYSIGAGGPATSPEMIIHHVDGIESMGFTNHFKLPHYVTFQADLKVFQAAEDNHD